VASFNLTVYFLPLRSPTLSYCQYHREILLFYVWPVIVLFLLETSYIAAIYLIAVGISGLRHYLNIISVIEETGTMRLTPGRSVSQTWMKQSRLSDIVDKISTDSSKNVWLTVLGVLGFMFVYLFVSGLLDVQNGDTGNNTTLSTLSSSCCEILFMQVSKLIPCLSFHSVSS
jgi:hypothetical protein